MPFNPEKHQRRSIRLKDYDYSQPGSYFITICTHNHINLFGKIVCLRAGLEPARTNMTATPTSISPVEEPNKRNSYLQNETTTSEEFSMELNGYGKIVYQAWNNLVNHSTEIGLGEFVIMPNHIHAIIHILDPENDWDDFIPSNFIFAEDEPKSLPLNSERAGSVQASSVRAGSVRAGSKPAPNHHQEQTPLSEIIRQYKTFSARKINLLRKTPGVPVWKRDYYEHIIRDQESYNQITEYIQNNPMMWILDKFYKE